jgi:hypothetical protein
MEQLRCEGKDVQELLKEKKPVIHMREDDENNRNGTMWRDIWNDIKMSLGPMKENQEDWIYINHREGALCADKDAEIQEEFKSLESQGCKRINNDKVNGLKLFRCFGNLQTGELYRADFEFVSYCHPEGGPLCPVMLGLNVMVFGFTYIRVKIRPLTTKEKLTVLMATLRNPKSDFNTGKTPRRK